MKTPGLGHLTMFGLSRRKVVRNQDDLRSKVVGFHARKTAQRFKGCPEVHLTSQEGAHGSQIMSFLCLFLWIECLNVHFLPFLTHGGGFL